MSDRVNPIIEFPISVFSWYSCVSYSIVLRISISLTIRGPVEGSFTHLPQMREKLSCRFFCLYLSQFSQFNQISTLYTVSFVSRPFRLWWVFYSNINFMNTLENLIWKNFKKHFKMHVWRKEWFHILGAENVLQENWCGLLRCSALLHL